MLLLLKLYLGMEDPVSAAIYEKTNHQMEKWSKILYFWIAKIIPLVTILPKSIGSLYLYATTDLNGNDTLELPLPAL